MNGDKSGGASNTFYREQTNKPARKMINFITFTIDISFDGLAFPFFTYRFYPSKPSMTAYILLGTFWVKGKKRCFSQLTRSISDGVYVGCVVTG
ncbi:MAG: hypothetical protein WA118_10810 [Carboxydocellales bacterium]